MRWHRHEASTGAVQIYDELAAGSVTIPRATVELGSAPEGVPGGEVVFGQPVELSDGRFGASLEGASERIWARACLGNECSYVSRGRPG